MQKILLKIDKPDFTLLNCSQIECFILSSKLEKSFISKFQELASSNDKIVLIEGDNSVDLCQELNLDGIIIDLSKSESLTKDLKYIKQTLKDKIIGVIPRLRKHETMVVAELEPDFIIFKAWKDGFDNIKALIDWYMEFFLIQSATYLEENIGSLENLSSDMVILNHDLYKILVEK